MNVHQEKFASLAIVPAHQEPDDVAKSAWIFTMTTITAKNVGIYVHQELAAMMVAASQLVQELRQLLVLVVVTIWKTILTIVGNVAINARQDNSVFLVIVHVLQECDFAMENVSIIEPTMIIVKTVAMYVHQEPVV